MGKSSKVGKVELLNAGLELMRQTGRQLSKVPNTRSAMLYRLPNCETVRVRTCQKHVLNSNADSLDVDARLNIEGTDWLLFVMPEIEWTPGNVVAYFLPAKKAANDVRNAHLAWLGTNPKTKGNTKTRNIWFSEKGPATSREFHKKWNKYRLQGNASTEQSNRPAVRNEGGQGGDIKAQVEAARQRIAASAGVSVEAVKITIDFGI